MTYNRLWEPPEQMLWHHWSERHQTQGGALHTQKRDGQWTKDWSWWLSKAGGPNIERVIADHRPSRLYPCYPHATSSMLGRRALPSLNHVLKNISRPASTSTSKADNATSSAVTKKADVPLPTTQQQSPNYPSTWSTSQTPRPGLGSSPRFEQTAMDLQPNPLSAMELIANEPIRLVHGRKAVCDGGIYMFLSSFWSDRLFSVLTVH